MAKHAEQRAGFTRRPPPANNASAPTASRRRSERISVTVPAFYRFPDKNVFRRAESIKRKATEFVNVKAALRKVRAIASAKISFPAMAVNALLSAQREK